ncbi:hypothetical protein C8J33_101520 [Rhizobium sp. PP-CC-3G-465]|nr:hypothetical protein C8J33_101520 [Rhizobium sp. PP-CC-3G-465]
MTTVMEYFAWFDFAILCAIGALIACSVTSGNA